MLATEEIEVQRLKPWDNNPRKNDHAVEAVARSIETFGFNVPILCDQQFMIIAGHTRWKAAKKLGMAAVPVIRLTMTESQRKAFAVADNKTAEIADWDVPKLGALLEQLRNEVIDLSVMGFSDEELRQLLAEETGDENELPELPENPKTKMGDMWSLGRHRLLCGDSRDRSSATRLVGENTVTHAFAGAPCFNQKDYARWEDYDAYTDDMARVIGSTSARLKAGGIFVWHVGNDSTNHHDVTAHHSRLLESAGLVYIDTIIWRKSSANYTIPRNAHIQRSGRYYPAFQWEALLVYQKPGGPMPKMTRKAIEYMTDYHTNVWDIPPVSNPAEQRGHPGSCPVELPYRCLLAYTRPNERMFDPFAGSGTSLIACEKSSRVALVVERIPAYCDMIVSRWETLTGGVAERVPTDRRGNE